MEFLIFVVLYFIIIFLVNIVLSFFVKDSELCIIFSVLWPFTIVIGVPCLIFYYPFLILCHILTSINEFIRNMR